jgi:murein hydrolase activator
VAWRAACAAVAVLAASATSVLAAPANTPANTPANGAPNAPPNAPPNATTGELDFLRRECIGAAQDVQQHERGTLALEHDIDLLGRDAAGRQRGLDESRVEQAHLLAVLAYLARHPPDRPAVAPAGAIERSRGELLLQGILPGLREEARALLGEIDRIKVLRHDIATRQQELEAARDALGKDRERLAALTVHRLQLTGRLLPEESGADARIAKLGREASDIGDLIKRAEAAAEHRDKELLTRTRANLPKALKAMESALTADNADPTRPRALRAFDPPQSALQMPVTGTIVRRFGAADAALAAGGPTSQGIGLAVLPGAEVVAPFDGRVLYAGPFRNLGLVLIIRHGGLYHSLLAGFDQVDVKADQWVLAGEPVGAMPDAVDNASCGTLYVELRRDGRPVDPQPWLAPGDQGRSEPDGDQKVRE